MRFEDNSPQYTMPGSSHRSYSRDLVFHDGNKNETFVMNLSWINTRPAGVPFDMGPSGVQTAKEPEATI
jgi:hypothetical protein